MTDQKHIGYQLLQEATESLADAVEQTRIVNDKAEYDLRNRFLSLAITHMEEAQNWLLRYRVDVHDYSDD